MLRDLADAGAHEGTVAGDRVAYVVVGVGINVNVLHPQLDAGLGAAAADATSLREALGRPVDRNAFAAAGIDPNGFLVVDDDAGRPHTVASAALRLVGETTDEG